MSEPEGIEGIFKNLVDMQKEQFDRTKDKQGIPTIQLNKKVKNVNLIISGKDIDLIISVLKHSEKRLLELL